MGFGMVHPPQYISPTACIRQNYNSIFRHLLVPCKLLSEVSVNWQGTCTYWCYISNQTAYNSVHKIPIPLSTAKSGVKLTPALVGYFSALTYDSIWILLYGQHLSSLYILICNRSCFNMLLY